LHEYISAEYESQSAGYADDFAYEQGYYEPIQQTGVVAGSVIVADKRLY
jgi:hypothetical protein